ncbi:MAG: LysE family transporter [Candidatus Aminicenantes bacterium]|nr:LysE family transporter [Candidatus Aminicenantes bacterium]
MKKQNIHALAIGLGAALGDAVWALIAFLGITPFFKNAATGLLEGIFLLVASVITFIIGCLVCREGKSGARLEINEKTNARKEKRKRKRWSFLKGLTLVMVNPLGIGSWFIVLTALKKSNIYIPLSINYAILFTAFVIMGAFSYSVSMVAVASRIKILFNPGKTARIIKILGYILVFFSFYFLFFSLRGFLRF